VMPYSRLRPDEKDATVGYERSMAVMEPMLTVSVETVEYVVSSSATALIVLLTPRPDTVIAELYREELVVGVVPSVV